MQRNSKKKGTIMFTDIKTSSRLWRLYPEDMFRALAIHDELIKAMIDKNNGFVVKTIGDSFMGFFNNTRNAVLAAINIQKFLNENPIKVGNSQMSIRIGLASCELNEKTLDIQGCKLKDYFGNTVNTAARLESQVSNTGGFAIAFLDTPGQKMPKSIKKLIKERKFKSSLIFYRDTCPLKNAKLLGKECRLISQLKGLGETNVYVVDA